MLNHVEGIRFFEGTIGDASGEYDLVCANLTAAVIGPILGDLIEKTRRILVLSGILDFQEVEIAARLHDLGIFEWRTETEGEWISITIDLGAEESSG